MKLQDKLKVYNKIQNDPLFFYKAYLNKKLWSKQKDTALSIKENKKTTVKACHGVGKSFIAGNILLWFLFSHKNAIVITTAPTWRQVEKLIWKEVRASYNSSIIPLGGTLSPKSPELQIIQDEWYALGVSTNDPDKFQGFHEENILVIVDEAAGVDDKIYEGIEGIISTKGAKLLLIGNPTNTSGEFYKSFKDESFSKITISCFDSPNFKQCGITYEDIKDGSWQEKEKKVIQEKGKLIGPKMVSPEWVADKYKKWGPDSPLFKSKCLGEFPMQGDDSLIPISWVDAAIQRWYDKQGQPDMLSKNIRFGADVAEYGSDESVLAKKTGSFIHELQSYSGLSVLEYAGVIINETTKHKKVEKINVDVIGIGTGTEGRLREEGYPTNRVNVGESPGGIEPEEKDIFLNKRAQLYWYLRECLDPDPKINPDPLCLPPDDMLIADLTEIKYTITGKGKIQLESKKDMKKRLGRSPDRGDAVMLANAPDHLLIDKEVFTPTIRLL